MGWLFTILKAVLVIAFGIFALSFSLLLRNTYLPRYTYVCLPSEFGLSYEEVRFISKDGIELSGWFLPAAKDAPTIILCHGLGANRSDVMDFARFLYQGGYNILLFDFRAHGASQGHFTSFGYYEQSDLSGALDYLDKREDLENRDYGVFGVSMGGAVAIEVASRDMRIKAVVIDSAYKDLASSLSHYGRLLYHVPEVPFGFFARLSYMIRFRVDPHTISPVKAVSGISPRPVFIITEEADVEVLPQDARALFAAAGEPRELWIISNAGQMQGYAIESVIYEEKVLRFLKAYLKPR